jgi:hypothetical protein
MNERNTEAILIAAMLAALDKADEVSVAKAVRLYRACREKVVAEFNKPEERDSAGAA